MPDVNGIFSVNRNYKDTVFRMLFSDPQNLLSLYNALNHGCYEDPRELKIVTLENAIYMEVKNDIAYIIGTELYLYEHQSTQNPNMPLRFLYYIAAEYQKLTEAGRIYASRLQKIPAPHFAVFYNGEKEAPDRKKLYLSDAYEQRQEHPALELEVTVYNINPDHNTEMMQTCRTLRDYAEFVKRIRENQGTMSIEEAVSEAVDSCIRDDILKAFLEKNRSEVIGMSIFEFNRQEYEEMIRREEYEEGREEGREEGIETGKIQRDRELMEKMVELGMDNEAIMRILPFDEEQINCVREKADIYQI